MHEHAGRSLFVIPICWTDFHVRVLGAKFRGHPVVKTPVPECIPGQWLEPSHVARNLTTELHVLVRDQPVQVRLFNRTRAMKFVLGTLFPNTLSNAKSNVELDMYFGNRVFRKAIRVPCLWKSPSTDMEDSFDSTTTIPATSFGGDRPPTPPSGVSEITPNKPLLAYISKSHLALTRGNLFRVSPGPNGSNEAVLSLQRLRSKLLTPKNSDHDAYILGAIIAMAQAHFYHDKTSKSFSQPSRNSRPLRTPPTEFRDVKVQIITHDEGNDNTPNFVVYSATVTATFLERFMHPHKAPLSQEEMEMGAAGIKIHYTPVTFWPILGLKERLAKALGRDIAGEPLFNNPDHIGLWDTLVEEPQISLPTAIFSSPPRPIPAAAAAVRHTLKRRRHHNTESSNLKPTLSEVLNSSFEEDTTPNSSAEDLDRPVLSPDAKRRRTTSASPRGGGASGNPNPLEVC